MKIILSNSTRGAYRGVIEEMKAHLDGSSHVVLVPDRFTASVERGILLSLGLDCTADIEVSSFTRLADKLIGRKIEKCLTPEGSVMLLNKVINDRRGELSYYARSAGADGVADEIYAAVTAVRNSGISSTKLLERAEDMPINLRLKTRDLALIYEGYLKELEGRLSDSSTRLDALADYLRDCPPLPFRAYCTDFYSFKAPELEIFGGLSKAALSLTVGLVAGFDNANRRIYPSSTLERLKNAAENKAEIITVKEELHPAFERISQNLFSYDPPLKRTECGNKVKLRCAADRHDEVLALALDVRRKVRAGGRYSDCEVYVPDLENYAAEIKSAFARYDIPFFIDVKESLSDQAKVRYLLSALKTVRDGYKREDVLSLVKNPLFYCDCLNTEDAAAQAGPTADDVFLFENYILKYNVDRSRFFSRFEIGDEEERAVAEKVRRRLKEVLSPLDVHGSVRIEKLAQNALKFCENADGAWRKYAEKLALMSEYYAKCAEQVDKKLKSVLDEIKITDYVTDVDGFSRILESMLKKLKIALVPTYLDCVFVGDSESRFLGGGDIYVLGAVSGKLPSASAGGAVLTARDEELLNGLGLEKYPDRKRQAYDNMLAVCELMKKPHGRLTVSYPENLPEGAVKASPIIAELGGMLSKDSMPLKPEVFDKRRFAAADEEENLLFAGELFATDKAAYHELLRGAYSGTAVDGRGYFASAFSVLPGNAAAGIERVFREPECLSDPTWGGEYTSVSRLERFYQCPYSHYFKYVLGLKKRPEGEFEGNENGIILHYILEKFYKGLRDGKIDGNNAAACARGFFDAAIEEYGFRRLMEKPDSRRLLEALKEEGAKVCADLYEIYLRSEFKPAFLEAKIGEGSIEPLSVLVSGKKLSLNGKIDRVDIADGCFIVVDYKTYRSADLSLSELYYGEKIQLYIYMKAIENSGLTPAGVYYLPIYVGFGNDSGNRYKFRGQSSSDEEILKKIDSFSAEEPDKSVVPIARERNGALKAGAHLDREQFDLIGDYVLSLAAAGAEEIARGFVKPSPMLDACKRCDYSDICAYRNRNERKPSKVTMQSFTQNGRVEEEK